MSLRSVDLNLLVILRELLKERSVSGAGRSIGMSHSAVSEALGRLRLTLGDPLLVRVGRGMELTPRASAMIDEVETLCTDLDRFFQKPDFDPTTTCREFVIAGTDLLALLFSRPMVDLVTNVAPGLRLHFTHIDSELVKRMSNREIDFALIPSFAIEDLAPAPLHYRPLSTGGTVALMSADHPLATREIVNQADLMEFKHVCFQPDAMRAHAKRSLALNGGGKFDVSCSVGQFMLVPHLLRGTNHVSLVPEQAAFLFREDFGLCMIPLDFEQPRVDVGISWSPVYSGDPVHRWFRSLVEQHFRERERAAAPHKQVGNRMTGSESPPASHPLTAQASSVAGAAPNKS